MRQNHVLMLIAAIGVASSLWACNDDKKQSNDTLDTSDAADSSGDTNADTAADLVDVPSADTTANDTSNVDVPCDTSDLGFFVRVPQTRTVTCGDGTTADAPDVDLVCQLPWDGKTYYVYVQSHPTACFEMMMTPTFDVDGAWMSVDGTVTEADATYDWGGNHHNDQLQITYAEMIFQLYHSSFGFGWRSCARPDCLILNDLNLTIVQDGCSPTRTLPVICVSVNADGSLPEFVDPLIDNVEMCGDCKNLCPDTATCSTDVCMCGSEVCDPKTMPGTNLSCATGTCTATCKDGWGDCDNDMSNGCEVDLTQPDNCGTCGNVCASGFCNGTACQ